MSPDDSDDRKVFVPWAVKMAALTERLDKIIDELEESMSDQVLRRTRSLLRRGEDEEE